MDKVVEEKVDDKILAKKYKFNIIFKGDDWKNSEKWKDLKKRLKKLDTEVFFYKIHKRNI